MASLSDLLNVLVEEQRQIHEQREEANRQLRRWKTAYYVIGVTSIVTAAIAGVAGLADLVTVQAAGAIAVASAALGAIDKFLGAGGQVERLTRQCQSLRGEDSWVDITVESARAKQEDISSLKATIKSEEGTPQAEADKKLFELATADYNAWIQRKTDEVQAYLSEIMSNGDVTRLPVRDVNPAGG